jgi:hypothetical protein
MKQHDDSRASTFKSGGQRIDDHSFWAGKPGKDTVFPDGPHKTKEEKSANGAGEVMTYEDTTEQIKRGQDAAEKKIRAHKMKEPNYRN